MVTRSELERIQAAFEKATCPEAIFGAVEGATPDARIAAVNRRYRSLARLCHPDVVTDNEKELAEELFTRLAAWQEQAERKLLDGTYGDNRPAMPPFAPVTLVFGREAVTLTNIRAQGLLTTVYEANYTACALNAQTVLKVASEPSDNDLIEREFEALTAIRAPHPDKSVERDFYAKQRVYVPEPLGLFPITGAAGERRNALLLATPRGRCFTAQELRERRFTEGIEPKHVWWILRRLLLTLWMAHLRGYVHGGVTPDHLLIYPEQHGIVLLDWTSAARLGVEKVPLYNPAWEPFYPPEVMEKKPATVATDLYLATQTALYLLGEKEIPPKISLLLRRCLDPRPGRRPQDAERFHAQLGDLLGKREFAEFVV